MELMGKSQEEIDKRLTYSHEVLLKVLAIVKTSVEINPMKVQNYYIEKLQNSLIDSTGYMTKKVNYKKEGVIVTFTDTLFPAKELVGKGKNELEAICNACDNFLADPYEYNTYSKKYLNQLKK